MRIPLKPKSSIEEITSLRLPGSGSEADRRKSFALSELLHSQPKKKFLEVDKKNDSGRKSMSFSTPVFELSVPHQADLKKKKNLIEFFKKSDYNVVNLKKKMHKRRVIDVNRKVKEELMKSMINLVNKPLQPTLIPDKKIAIESFPMAISFRNKDIRRFEEVFEDIYEKREKKIRAKIQDLYSSKPSKFQLRPEEYENILKRNKKFFSNSYRETRQEQLEKHAEKTMILQRKVMGRSIKQKVNKISKKHSLSKKWTYNNLSKSTNVRKHIGTQLLHESMQSYKSKKEEKFPTYEESLQNANAKISDVAEKKKSITSQLEFLGCVLRSKSARLNISAAAPKHKQFSIKDVHKLLDLIKTSNHKELERLLIDKPYLTNYHTKVTILVI